MTSMWFTVNSLLMNTNVIAFINGMREKKTDHKWRTWSNDGIKRPVGHHQLHSY